MIFCVCFQTIFFAQFHRKHADFTVEHYNELLRVYLANNKSIIARSFISKMGDVQPDSTTYDLLLKVLGEVCILQILSKIDV